PVPADVVVPTDRRERPTHDLLLVRPQLGVLGVERVVGVEPLPVDRVYRVRWIVEPAQSPVTGPVGAAPAPAATRGVAVGGVGLHPGVVRPYRQVPVLDVLGGAVIGDDV